MRRENAAFFKLAAEKPLCYNKNNRKPVFLKSKELFYMPNPMILFPGGRKKALTLSYDDGVEQDVRLIEIMNRSGLKGTFNINSGEYAPEGTVYPAGRVHRRMTEAQVTALYKDSGHEIATHGLTHPFLERLPLNLATYEVMKDRENLEAQFDTIVRGHAYPYGTYNDDVVDILKNCGIVYARTVETTGRFDLPVDWLRLKATCHHDDPKLQELTDQFLDDDEKLPPFARRSKFFYMWGHSYEFEGNDNWNVIENFAARVGNRSDVWYCTNIEAYDYIEAFRSLLFSVDGKRVQNPSAQTVWFTHLDRDVKLAPGESMTF